MLLTANLILISPLMLLATIIAIFGVRWLRLWPQGVHTAVMAPLLFCGLYASLALFSIIDSFVVTPARLQRAYLGAEYATPFKLIRYESGGFQDPYQIWHYGLDGPTVTLLRSRCKQTALNAPTECLLFGAQDDRWFASVSLDRNILEIEDGLQ